MAFSDLGSTTGAIFDFESARGADEGEGRTRDERETYLLCEKSNQYYRKPGEIDGIIELKPRPLFSGRRSVADRKTGAFRDPSQRSSVEDFGGLSFSKASRNTSTTSRSGMMRSTLPEHSGNDSKGDDILYAFPTPPKSPERMTAVTNDGQMLQGNSPIRGKSLEFLSGSAENTRTLPAVKPARSTTPSSDVLRAVTYPSNTLFHSNLGSSRPLPPFYAEASAALLHKADAKAQQPPTARPRERRVVSAKTSSAELYTKVWAPPPYPPSRSRSQSPAKILTGSGMCEYEEVLRRFQDDPIGLKRSASTSSVTPNGSKNSMLSISSPPLVAADEASKRYDSFGYIDVASGHDSISSRKHPLLLDAPLQPHLSLETRPHTSGEHTLREIERSLEALECTDERQSYASRLESAPLKILRRHGVIRRIASAASDQLRRHFTPLGSRQQRGGASTRPSSSASNIMVAADDTHGSNHTATPIPTNSTSSKPFGSPPSHARYGIEVERIPAKALRVLGPIDTGKEIEAQQKRRARDKERIEVTRRLHEAGF